MVTYLIELNTNLGTLSDLSTAVKTSIVDAINWLGLRLINSIAPEYSASSTYAVGVYRFYDKVLYKCTTAITVAEAWNASHWTAVYLGNELSTLNAKIGNIATTKRQIATVLGGTGGNGWCGFTIIPLTNADKFNITINSIGLVGDSESTANAGAYTITKTKDGIYLVTNNVDEKYRLGSLLPNRLWYIDYTATYVG